MKQAKQLEQSKRKTRICKRCFCEINDATLHNLLFKDLNLCHKCLNELKPVFNEFTIEGFSAVNLYWYNEKIQEALYQFKGCGDIELKTIFIDYFWDYLKQKYRKFTAIPAPSSEEAIKIRGFKQVEEMFERLNIPLMCCIHKTDDIKQHNLNSEERKEIKNTLVIDDVDLTDKKILILDDVYTTGSTIKSMISLIKTKNPRSIKILVMAKTIDLNLR